MQVLKHAACVLLGLLALTPAPPARGQAAPASPPLQRELAELLRTGRFDAAVQRAQEALRAAPASPEVRREYVDLHLSLARLWLEQRRFPDAQAALGAVLAAEPGQAEATRMHDELQAARERAGAQVEEVAQLLKLELFESALDVVREAAALRPDLAPQWAELELNAWRGVADDHYLARNFAEAFALYENVLARDADAPAELHTRWAISLALAVAESETPEPVDENATGRLLARAVDVLRRTAEPALGQILGGLLAEQAGKTLDAARTYAEALGIPWEVPPADRRRARVRELRDQAVRRARQIYEDTPLQRRQGFWSIGLPNVWKQRQTEHFDVYAHNDVVAQRVAEAAEYHYAGISRWLGREPVDWEPRCEIRVHGRVGEFHVATGTRGMTRAISHTRLDGDRVLLRKLEVYQLDPWLLSSTLPHELTHLLVADAYRAAQLPLTLDEGLALQAEPPARRLMYRRLLAETPPAPAALLAASQLPRDVEAFYAESGALTSWLLDRLSAVDPGREPVRTLLARFENGLPTPLWPACGFASEAELQSAWAEWYAARRRPARMPLMILVEPSTPPRRAAPAQPAQ
jgi:tetratricopeptide (TPR) repeat protein